MVTHFFNAIRGGNVRVVDLTHTLDKASPHWPEDLPFRAGIATTYQKDGYFTQNLCMAEHSGTHMDASIHFDPKGESVDKIPVENFLAPGVVIDVSSAVASDDDYRVTAQDIENWVKAHGDIPDGAVVFFRTGWDKRWPSQEKYMNADAEGVLHFPGLSMEAARYLLDHSRLVGVGIDTGSTDYGPSRDSLVHHLMLTAGVYQLENVANLGQLPATGFHVIALPLKLGGGSGAPARVLAFSPTQSEVRH